MEHRPDAAEPTHEPVERSSLRSRSSVALKVAIAVLVVALIGVSSLAFVALRHAQDLEASVARQRGDLEDLRKEVDDAQNENPLDDLLGEGAGDLFGGEDPFGEGTEDLLGGGSTSLLSCIGGGGALGGDPGDLFGGGGGGSDDSLSPEQRVGQIADQVEKLRELDYSNEVEADFLGDAALERRISDLFLEDYTPEFADAEGRILGLLGAVPPGSDMAKLRREALEGQVAGFYVPETKELVVRSSGDVGAVEKITLAHELEHALADQKLDLPVPEDPDPSRADEELAALSLVEGDATLTMQQYALQHLGFDEQLALASDPEVLQAQQQLAELPHYLQQELGFPYLEGLNFVCDLYFEGGWDAVDEAYTKPPTSSDQILFPERFRSGEEATDPRDPASLEEPWQEELTSSLGAAELKWLFEAPGGDTSAALSDPDAAVAAWGGGELTLWTDGEQSAVGVALVQRSGESGLCEGVTGWYEAAFPDASQGSPEGEEALVSDGADQDAVVTCSGSDVRLGIAPDVDDARTLTE